MVHETENFVLVCSSCDTMIHKLPFFFGSCPSLILAMGIYIELQALLVPLVPTPSLILAWESFGVFQ